MCFSNIFYFRIWNINIYANLFISYPSIPTLSCRECLFYSVQKTTGKMDKMRQLHMALENCKHIFFEQIVLGNDKPTKFYETSQEWTEEPTWQFGFCYPPCSWLLVTTSSNNPNKLNTNLEIKMKPEDNVMIQNWTRKESAGQKHLLGSWLL
jgi:hypothetical protein